MTLKQKNKLLIDTLAAVYPLVGRGFVTVGTVMSSGHQVPDVAAESLNLGPWKDFDFAMTGVL